MNIPVYQSELAVAGLVDRIQQQTSVAFLSPIIYEPVELEQKAVAEAINKLCLASENDTDLYTTKSILVSTNWNKNDDVFDAKEVWAARNTPSHKPTNIGHDEHKICGHITNVWAIANDGSIIPDNTNIDELPFLYHLVNAAVIYKNWSDQELVDRTDKLIAEIKDGKKFVSMEALFTNFDYATYKDNPNELKIIARAEDTAWMTKHLRIYGGSGEYDGHKIGRVLRNITFCGKGYVDKPANPNSIIFANLSNLIKDNENNIILENVVYNNNKEIIKGEEMSPEELKAKNDELEAKIKKMESDVEQINKDLASANETIKAKDAEIVSANTKVDELVKANTELTEQINKVKAAELKTNRVAKLVDGGIDKVEAEKKVELFVILNDEQFDAVASELIGAAKAIKEAAEKKPAESTESAKKEDEEDMEDEEKDCKGEKAVEDENLENVEAEKKEDVDLTASAETVDDKELDEVRNELVEAIASFLGPKQKKSK